MLSILALHRSHSRPGRHNTCRMTIQVGPGTQATNRSLIEEEASALPHYTIQWSFSFAALVYILWTCKTSIRYRGLESDHLLLSCSAYSSCDSSTVRAIRTP